MTSEHTLSNCPGDEILSAHLDGDLEPGRMDAISEHLVGCEACRRVRDDLAGLTSDLLGLAPAPPERDLWPAIAARRQAEGERGLLAALRRWWMLPMTAAVGAALALLVVWVIGAGTQPTATGAKGPLTALDAVLQAEQIYARSIADMEQAMGQEKPGFSPEVQQTIASGLAEVDQAIEKCRATLRQHPRDLEAHEAMLAAYQHKVDFMTELLGERM